MHTSHNCCTFPIADVGGLKKKVLNWLRPFNTFCFLDNQQYSMAPHEAEALIAAGVRQCNTGGDVKGADRFFEKKQWLFGHLSYELKDTLHHLQSGKKDKIGFPPYFFFTPQVLLKLNGDALTIEADDPEVVFEQINGHPSSFAGPLHSTLQIEPVLSRQEYIQKIKDLQAHILRGDCYEINFCQEFSASEVTLEPFAVFQNLMEVSPNPFSAFYRVEDAFLICASPERFLTKKGRKLLSQPIKGTIQRDKRNAVNDEKLKAALQLSQKEQAENVMVVDLVRNDLTKICIPTSVKVEELFGIYSFPQVHQMISTVSGTLEIGHSFSQIMEATFPMGSMTGAPKRRVMELIEEYELSARGIFSGSVGYKSPEGDFDFNVVIRSIMYNKTTGYLSYQVGSGITFYSDAEKEWEECMLKAEAIRKVLTNNSPALPA